MYWTLVILSEQPFLKAPPSPSSAGGCPQAEAKQRCMEAALKIWKITQAYESTFTLARAQYGHLYATYCAVFVIVYQDTERQCLEQTEAAQFFLDVLSKYQKGCFTGLKKPLDMLKLLMRRYGTAATGLDESNPRALEILPTSGRRSPSKEASDIGPPIPTGDTSDKDIEWTAWLRAADDGGFFDLDDTIYGIFMPG
jgi:hypothetical protein